MTSLRFLMTIVFFFAQKSHSFVTGPALQKGRAKSKVFSGTTETLEDGFRFEEMKKLAQRLKSMEELGTEFLMDFYDSDLYSFSIRPGSASKISITSTCYSVQAILTSSDPSAFLTKSKQKLELESIIKALLDSSWKEEDIYQVSLILLTLLRYNPNLTTSNLFDSDTKAKVSKLINLAFTARPRRRYGQNQLFSAYLSFLCCSIYASLNDSSTLRDGQLVFGPIPEESVPEGAATDLPLALVRCRETSFNEMCKSCPH